MVDDGEERGREGELERGRQAEVGALELAFNFRPNVQPPTAKCLIAGPNTNHTTFSIAAV